MSGHVYMSASTAQQQPTPAAESRILSKAAIRLRGKPACRVRFVYEGRGEEDLFWEEPCASITVRFMAPQDLKAIGKWARLDGFAQASVAKLPGSRVLYIEGRASASVYPIGTGGTTYEVPVAD